MTELIRYRSEDSQPRLHLLVEGQSVWISRLEIAERFQATKQNVSFDAKNIFKRGELSSEATVKKSMTVQVEGLSQIDGKRQYLIKRVNNNPRLVA